MNNMLACLLLFSLILLCLFIVGLVLHSVAKTVCLWSYVIEGRYNEAPVDLS